VQVERIVALPRPRRAKDRGLPHESQGFLGADVDARPFDLVLRGPCSIRAARFLDSRRGDLAASPLWWPPTKVAAEHVGRYLSPRAACSVRARRQRAALLSTAAMSIVETMPWGRPLAAPTTIR
jgi:hypothetical protein